MNKTLARVLAAILVLCMLPATFLTALAGGLGVAKNETENQSIDNANGQYIPETIVIDGKFDDTGWAIEGWSYVTASTGNWNVESPDKDAQTMMYQYQLRADYKYFYAGAVVVLPANMNSAQFKVYLSDDASTYKTASLFTVSLDKTATEKGTLVVKDCDSSDSVSVALNGDLFKCEYLGDGKFYIEFRNAAANSYNTASDVQIKYYVSLDVQVDGKWQSLYHPVYTTANNGHAVPTSEYWPGGGNLLEVGYTDLEIRNSGSQYHGSNPSQINPGTDGYKGAVTLDGLFNEDIWKGLTDYYTLDSDKNNLVDFVNADKGIIGGFSSEQEYTGTSSHLADTSTVHWLPNNLVAGNEYSTIVENIYTLTNGTSGTHESYDDTDHKELTDGITLNDYEYLNTDTDGGKYHNPNFVVWNVDAKNKEGQVGMDVRIPLGNGADTYPLQVVYIYTGTLKCNNEWSSSGGTSSNGIRNQAYTVEYTPDGITWLPFGTVAKDESYATTYIRKNVVSVTTPVYAKGIRITSTGVSSLAFVSEIEAFASTAAANKSTTYTNSTTAPNDPTFVGKYDFRADDEYFYGALITTSRATTLKVGSTTVTTKYGDYTKTGYKYEFKVKKAGLDFDSGVSVTVDSVLYNGMIVNHYNNNAADDVNYDGKLTDSIWAPVTAGDKEFYYASNSGKVFSDFETLIYDVKSDYEYIYGAAIVKLEDIDTWEQENSKLRLYINPRGEAGGSTDLNYYVVEMYYTNTSHITATNAKDRSFVRILKYDGTVVQTEDITYRWSELCYIRKDEANNTLTFEFKIPYKLFSWKGVNEFKSSERQKHNDFFTDISKSDSDIAFTYMVSLYNMDTVYERFFSKELIYEKRAMTMNQGSAYVNYKQNCVDVTYGDFIDTVAIDGHIDEEVWQDKDFYQANFSNSTLLTQPTKGEVYDYSYMLYGGSNYIYGAVELNDIAREGTTFTLWLNNFVDEYKWIGDDDAKTPFITYDIDVTKIKRPIYTGSLTKNSDGEVVAEKNGETDVVSRRLQYYTNYKYEFDLSAAKSTATPDYYFATDSNLEKDKTKIVENVNYKYAITTINGKTYLEFMIDVDNFHWDYNSFEYITSVKHTTSGVAGEEELTLYHPAINDRTNLWLTNINTDNGYRHDGSGQLWTDATLYNDNLPPTRFWYSMKLKPTGNGNQYQIIEMTESETKWKLESGNTVKKSSWVKGTTEGEWHKYTKEESDAGIIFYIMFTGTTYGANGGVVLPEGNVQLTYPWADPLGFEAVTYNNKKYYINKYVLDGSNPRAEYVRGVLFGWDVGDVVEFGMQDTAQIENKAQDGSKNVLKVSGTTLYADKYNLVDPDNKGTTGSLYGKQTDVFGTDNAMPTSGYFGTNVKINRYSYVNPSLVDGESGSSSSSMTDIAGKELNDGIKLAQSDKTAVLLRNHTDASKEMAVIANVNSGSKSNVYTAYLTGGIWGIYATGINMLVYGRNAESEPWHRITAASYRQTILRKGDGISTTSSETSYSGTTKFNKGQASVALNGNLTAAQAQTRLSDGKTPATQGFVTADEKYFKETSTFPGAGVMLHNPNYGQDNGDNNFFIDTDLGSEKDVDRVMLGLYVFYKGGYGFPDANINVWTSTNGTDYTKQETIKFQDKFDAATATEHGNNAFIKNYYFSLSKTYNTQYIRLHITFPKVLSGANPSSNATWKYWKNMCITDVQFAYSSLDNYTLTAIADETKTYSQIKFVFEEASSSNNFIAVEELEVAYNSSVESMATQTILHLNTDQGSPGTSSYKGRYNTTGSTWINNGTKMEKPVEDSNNSAGGANVHPNNVLAETIPLNGYENQLLSSAGMHTNFYIERVSSNVDQSNRPDDSGTNKWDKATNGILKKLEHIAPDVIDVDGDLGDTGWDGVWTDVDGLKNATNFNGTGTDFKYQLRADGEYLYVAAIIDAAYESANPEFKLWIKSDDAATTFTHLYSAGKGETVLAIGAQATDSNGVVDDPYLVYGKENVDGSITLNGAFGAVQNDSSTPNGLSKIINKNNYLDSAIFGYTKEVVESTHDGVWSWTENPITQGHRVALEHGYIGSAAGKSVGNAIGTDSQTIVEFRVALSEFGGADGFEYFVEATTTSGSTIYPHIYTEKGYDEYHHPSWSWDSSSAKKVTAEDMTGWGIYRMVNDYAPMTSLGAKVNPSYGENNQKAIRFGARYTEEFIRRQATVEGTDYWDVETAGIVFVPTHVIPTYNPYDLTIETSSAKVVEALDIVNWKNDTPDGSTNFADYTSFVFYVNLVGIPDAAVNMEFSFRGFVDYYGKVSGSDTYYGIPLERSYSLVGRTENEGVIDDARNAELYDYSVKIENGNGVDYYSGYSAANIAQAESLLCDGNVPYYLGSLSSSHHDADKTPYAYLFKNTDPANNADCTFSTILTYEQEVAFDTVDLGLYMIPRWKIAPPKSVIVYVKENGVWVEKETIDDIYPYTVEVMQGIGISSDAGNELSRALSVSLSEKYVAQEIKLEFTFPEFVYIKGMTEVDSSTDWNEFQFVGLTEVGLSIR